MKAQVLACDIQACNDIKLRNGLGKQDTWKGANACRMRQMSTALHLNVWPEIQALIFLKQARYLQGRPKDNGGRHLALAGRFLRRAESC